MSSSLHDLLPDCRGQPTPTATAVVDGDRSLTYAELDVRSNRLAHLLAGARRAARRPRRALPRQVARVRSSASTAILKPGAAYVPLDPSAPPARLGYIAANAGLRCLVTGAEKAELWPDLLDAGAPVEALVAPAAREGEAEAPDRRSGCSTAAALDGQPDVPPEGVPRPTRTSPTSSTRRARPACPRA